MMWHEKAAVGWMTAIGLGLASVAACAASLPEGNQVATPSAQALAKKPSPRARSESKPDAGPPGQTGKDSPDRCPHGALEDPHRGFIRCLRPDEKDADWLPPPPQREPEPPADSKAPSGDAGAPEAPAPPPAEPPAPAAPAVPPRVEVKAPSFTNGEVPRAQKFMNGLTKKIGQCVADNGGLSKASGSMKVQFLVRFRGRAEGVEVLRMQNVSPEAASCVRLLLKNRAVGAPTMDPVGVTVDLTFTQASK